MNKKIIKTVSLILFLVMLIGFFGMIVIYFI